MKRILTIYFVLAAAISSAQGTLEGIVTGSGEPLFAAAVGLNGTSHAAVTDEKGHYRIEGIPEGEYILRISYVGCQPTTLKVRISSNAVTKADAAMVVSASGLNEVVITGTMKKFFTR